MKHTGIVFNIQRYSIHDGPGIRTTIFLKGCPLTCFWCQNPESQTPAPELLFDGQKCRQCGACAAVCPTGASQIVNRSVTIDRGRCERCGRCVDICPAEARRMAGKQMTIDDVMDEAARDARFYENSGGGITLSGGEPLAQSAFACALLARCKQENFHTALDTCGYASWKTIEKLLPFVDLVLFDIKHPDTAKHRGAVGEDNRMILENAKKISVFKPMWVRVPLIPGFNDSPEVVGRIARFVARELNGAKLEILPYNQFGEAKYHLLDKRCTTMQIQNDAALKTLRSVVARETGQV